MSRNDIHKTVVRCAYIRSCYLAEELKCFGYKTDCVLYQKSNGEFLNQERFDLAVDNLIRKTKVKYESETGK